MNFRLTEEQEMIRQMTADLLPMRLCLMRGVDKNGTVPFETIAKCKIWD